MSNSVTIMSTQSINEASVLKCPISMLQLNVIHKSYNVKSDFLFWENEQFWPACFSQDCIFIFLCHILRKSWIQFCSALFWIITFTYLWSLEPVALSFMYLGCGGIEPYWHLTKLAIFCTIHINFTSWSVTKFIFP